jgi:hypothetical protein
MFARILLIGTAICGLCLKCPARAAVIFESGTLGTTGVTKSELLNQSVPGTNVNSSVFVGARFLLTQQVMISRIGGHFISDNDANTFFGAIIRLSDSEDFPDSGDLSTTDVLGSGTLTFPNPSNETSVGLTLNLAPDWYAIVFGSGLFNTDGIGAAVRNGTDFGVQSYIAWQPNAGGWFNLSDLSEFGMFNNHRFVIEGSFIPEPSTITAFATAILLITLLSRSGRK